MDFYESENTEHLRDVCVPAVVGGMLGFLSPLTLAHPVFWAIPLIALAFLLWAGVLMLFRPGFYAESRCARWGLVLAIFFGMAAIADAGIYRAMDHRRGQTFAGQWFSLMLEGRDKEACQLGMISYQRVSGRGIVYSFANNPTFIETYRDFQKRSAVQTILREFQGGQAKYLRQVKVYQQKKRWAYTYEYELSVGTGLYRKTRLFHICVECSAKDGERRYEWKWMHTEFAPQ